MFSHVGISLQRPVFAHGQLYVAASRVGNRLGLHVHVEDTDAQGRRTDSEGNSCVVTDNVVYREVLGHASAEALPARSSLAAADGVSVR